MQSQDPAAIRKQICQQASIDTPKQGCPSCVFLHGTEQKPYSGAQCNVFALKDHIGRSIAMRIYRRNDRTSTYLLQNELKYRREIERLGLEFFQKIISFSETGNQLVSNPFICLTWAEGQPLTWSDGVPETRSKRNDLIKKLANSCLDLLSIQEEGNSNLFPFIETQTSIVSITGMVTDSSNTETSAKDEITAKLQRKIKRAEKGQYPGGNAESCIKQLDLLEKYWIPELDSAPRVLIHGDLSANNVIVDKDSNLVSIIDLGWAEMVPLQFAAAYPRFLTHEPPCKYGPFDWAAKNTVCMQEDRLVFRECVRDRAVLEGGLCQIYHDLLCREDEVNRHWWLTAISEPDKHKAMDLCGWSPQPISSPL